MRQTVTLFREKFSLTCNHHIWWCMLDKWRRMYQHSLTHSYDYARSLATIQTKRLKVSICWAWCTTQISCRMWGFGVVGVWQTQENISPRSMNSTTFLNPVDQQSGLFCDFFPEHCFWSGWCKVWRGIILILCIFVSIIIIIYLWTTLYCDGQLGIDPVLKITIEMLERTVLSSCQHDAQQQDIHLISQVQLQCVCIPL